MFKIIDCVYSRLVNLRDECVGALYGIMSQNTLVITSLSIETSKENGLESFNEMQLHFPTGIDYCGVFRCQSTASEGESIDNIIKEVQITDNPLFLEKDANGEMTAMVLRDGRLTETCLKIISEKEFLDMFVFLRLRGSVSLRCLKSGSGSCLDETQKTLSEDCIFHFSGTNVYLYNDEDVSSKKTLRDVMKTAPRPSDPRLKKGLLEVQIFHSMSSSGEKQLSSFLILPDSKHEKTMVQSTIDAICIAEHSRSIDDLYGLLTDTFCRHMQLVENTINSFNNNMNKLTELQIYHFYVAPHFVTLMSLRNNDDVQTKGIREELHRLLALPRDRPYFRRGNRLAVCSKPEAETILYNVHEGLSSGLAGGKQAVVSGLYSYHHYMQDNINDDGWGCAYRSLQTIFSWYKYQGYTDAKIPSHRDIQTCLVDIGDKEKKFIGTKEWIGSAEVGYCLNTWIGITTYTLTYGSGTALKSSGPDLIKHFELHGTPIMIGGGQLAHTILGVDYNEDTEEIKFLILDPHYTGKEDLKTIQSKGWVGWKPLEFWKKNSFYNMCLPSRPRVL